MRDEPNMPAPITLHRVRAVCDPLESQRIIDALVAAGTVSDTRGFSTAGLRVAEFLDQHAAGGRYAALYPAPAIDDDAVYGEHDPFIAVGSSLVFDIWQFDYGGVVHGHIMCHGLGSHPNMCTTPARHARPEFLGTCSRRPASTFNFNISSLSDDNLAAYIFNRDNTAIPGWVQAFDDDMYAACNARTVSGPPLDSADWWRVATTGPGTDIVHDATGGTRCVEGTYRVTVNPDYLGTGT